ncbi:MAG: hypothetical protein LBG43_01375 [Treponema sp.]|jgi:hypothetical protein|nr:hypothetical protein [Treponema sp.]
MAREKSFDMAEEFAALDFHSIRLEDRFVRTMETRIQQPDKSIWEAGESRVEASDFSPRQSAGRWGMKVLTGRRSSGRAGKRPYAAWPAVAEPFQRFRTPRGSATTPA